MNKEHETKLSISYTKIGDYYFPNLAPPPKGGNIGLWGRRRKEFLRNHRPILFNELLLTGELSKHLVQVNQEATERLETIIAQMKDEEGITEALKASDQMAWPIFSISPVREFVLYRL